MEANRRAKSGGKSGIFAILAVLGVLLLPGGEGYCRTITVRADGTGEYPTIQAAIDDANDGDEVMLEAGTYTGNGNRDIDFLGKAITVRSSDPNDANVVSGTVIASRSSPWESGRYRGFYFHNGEDGNSILEGLTVTGGLAPLEEFENEYGTFVLSAGGGVFCRGSSPTIKGCWIIGNSASGTSSGGWPQPIPVKNGGAIGGGVSCWESSASIIDCVVSENSVGADKYGVTYGGGIDYQGGSGVVSNCKIVGNYGQDSYAGAGGGVCCWGLGCNVVISNCVISGNLIGGRIYASGGGIGCLTGRALVSDCSISDNIVGPTYWTQGPVVYSNGGGIYCGDWTKAVITRCAITNNSATGGHGLSGADGEWGAPGIVFPPLINKPDGDDGGDGGDGGYGGDARGGGIYCAETSDCLITNCVVRGNQAAAGGGGDGGDGGKGGYGAIGNEWNGYPAGDGGDGGDGGNGGDSGIAEGGGMWYGCRSEHTVKNCTILDNTIVGSLGGEKGMGGMRGSGTSGGTNGSNGIAGSDGSDSSGYGGGFCGNAGIIHCILRGDAADYGSEAAAVRIDGNPSSVSLSYCDVEGLEGSTYAGYGCTVAWGEGNIDVEPELTADGHLLSGSGCIDAGDPNYTVGPNETDIDGEQRGYGGIVDIGIDEFIDSDGDGLPDWWEREYFGDATAAEPEDDSDGDGRDNITEYIRSSNPVRHLFYYVDAADGDDAWDGLTAEWDGTHGPKATIQAAINIADAYEGTVVIAEGRYKGYGNRDINFKGKIITVRSTDPEDAAVVAATVIDCNGTRDEPHRGFKFGSGEGPDSVLAGVTVTNGYGLEEEIQLGRQSGNADVGGGIFCHGSSPTITKCVISSSKAEWGGGVCCIDSNTTVKNCNISGNEAFIIGSGICFFDSDLTIEDCTVKSNEDGSGIACLSKSSPNIRDCTISDNEGVGIACDIDGEPNINSCVISGNKGGGIVDCRGTIRNCIISGNSAEEGAGLMYCYCPIMNCIITDNIAEYGGGGISETPGPIINCVISNNRARYGGGLYLCWGAVTNCIITGNMADNGGGLRGCTGPITNCTITGNIAEDERGNWGLGAGIYECDEATNCIVRGNWPDQVYDRFGRGLVTYSNVEGGWEGEGNIDAEPGFALEGNYHIMAGSPCIDAGTNDPCGGLTGADFDGVTRPLDGDGDGNSVADMGAYEFNPNSPTIAVSADSFHFAQDWPGREPQTLLIRNSGGVLLNWQVVEDCNWLQVVPGSGASEGEIVELRLIVDANGLAPGVYEYTFVLWDPNSPDSQIGITVTLPVGSALQVPSAEYPTIQSAIDAASDYDIVVVADGTYTGVGNKELDFGGKSITVRSENGPDNCVIDCEDSQYGFVFENGEMGNSVVDGFTITNASFAVVFCEGSSPTIRNCKLIENNGGIICGGQSGPSVINCTLIDNIGAGIVYNWRSSRPKYTVFASVSDCIISNNGGMGILFRNRGHLEVNRCEIMYNGFGNDDIKDGICCHFGGLTVRDCNIGGNDGSGILCGGGPVVVSDSIIEGNTRIGIYCEWGDLKVDNCIIRKNTEWMSGYAAGIMCGGNAEITNCVISDNAGINTAGVACGGRETKIENCIISNNRATKMIGGISCYWQHEGGNLTISNCEITANGANEMGGAWFERYENVEISNCLIAGNSAELGVAGIVLRNNDNIMVRNCTVSDNETKSIGEHGTGGGISFYGGNISVDSCILWGNKGPEGPQMYLGSNSNVVVSYSDVEGGQEDVYVSGSSTLNWGEGSIAVDPCFALAGDYHIMWNSPCVDGGDANYFGGAGEADLDGNPRVLDGDGDGNETIDMGAYEYNPDIASIAASPRSFWFMQDWPEREPQTLSIRNCGGQELNWKVVEDCKWLEVTPVNGVSVDEVDKVTLTVDPNGLAPGRYSYTLTVEDDNSLNSPVEVRVEMGVGEVLWVPSAEFWTIQAAVDAANIYDVVVVQDGTYTGEGNRDIDFLGKAILVKSENGAEKCIIDCNGTKDEPHRGFRFHNAEDGNSVLEGFSIVNGFGPDHVGGAMLLEDSSPMITECIIKDNTGEGLGGSIYCMESKAEFSSCTITGNSAGFGGAIYCEGSGPIIKGCTITDNQGQRHGGGIHLSYNSDVMIVDSVISRNSASIGGGGAIYCRDSKLTISECVLMMNQAGTKGGGGGICLEDGEATIRGCVVSGNSSEVEGGGIVCRRSIVEAKNCIVSGNMAKTAGGIYSFYGGSLSVSNCTVTGNVAEEYGGGISTVRAESVITNCILWGNESPNGPEIYVGWADASTLVIYSDVEGGEADVYVEADANLYWGQGNIDAEPEFVEGGYWDVNGTPNDVNDDLWVEGDYHLLEGSPCIDAGDPNYAAGPGETDLDGKPRVADGDGDGEAVVDMGAYEAELPPIEVAMHFTPKSLNPKSKGKWMKAHMVLPEGFGVEDVDVNTPAVIEPVGIQSEYINAFINEGGLVELEIGFSRGAFCALGMDYGPAAITVAGRFASGRGFYGVDTIKILADKVKGLASFVSYWLEAGCGRPDWCGGADVDRDSAVDFEDFALFDTCCIEAGKD